jgi:hypothetical protein
MSHIEKLGYLVANLSQPILQARGVKGNEIHGRALEISTVFQPWKALAVVVVCSVCIFVVHFIYRTCIHYKWDLEYSRHTVQPPTDAAERNVIELPIAGLAQQKSIEIRRLERRQKYEQFLAPYTMVSPAWDVQGWF